MKRQMSALLALLALTASAGTASAAADIVEATKSHALAAAAFFQANGYEASRTVFNDPKSKTWAPDLYNLHVAGISANGKTWADGGFPELVDVDFRTLSDLAGVPFGKDVIEKTPKWPDGMTLTLQFLNPRTKKAATSHGYCVRPDANNILCGWSETD
jgi:hypothetical protein